MWVDIATALALVLVIEGIMPFINPDGMRRMLVIVMQLDDFALRTIGLTSMVIGVLLLYLVH